MSAKSGSKRAKKARQKQEAADAAAAAAAASAPEAPEAGAADTTPTSNEAAFTDSMLATAHHLHQHQLETTGISVHVESAAAGAPPPSADRTNTPPAATKADADSRAAVPSTAAPPNWTVCKLTGVRCDANPPSLVRAGARKLHLHSAGALLNQEQSPWRFTPKQPVCTRLWKYHGRHQGRPKASSVGDAECSSQPWCVVGIGITVRYMQ